MKKPSLKSATPNDVDANALYDETAHDLLTEAFNDPSKPNRILIVGVVRVTEAGGHDDGGNRVTKYRIDHIETALSEADQKKVTDLIVTLHRRRTQSSTVAALEEPTPDTPLDGLGEDIDDSVDDNVSPFTQPKK